MIHEQIRVIGADEIEEKLDGLKKKAPVILSRAINRASEKARTEAKREVSEKYFISQKNVLKTIRLKKASKAVLSAEMISRGSPIALSKFRVSQRRQVSRTKRGKASPSVYKAGVERAGGLKPLDGNPKAFFTSVGSGHEGVMERVSSRRLPLKELYGPAVPSMIKNEKIIGRIQEEASETLEKRIDAEINNILQGG